ncbi:MAG: ABC transporter permease [Clostridia bacterium]|nr:ABC transporter permease [Clostridia bacterium]
MIGMISRNLKVFFKDKTSVFFSLLAVFITVGLYLLFLGDIWVSNFSGYEGVRYMMDSWIMAGILAITSVTTTMGAYGTMIDDKTKKIDKDFTVSPFSAQKRTLAYIISAVIIGIIMSLVTLILAEIYIVINGGELMSFTALIKVLGLIVLSTTTNSALVFFIVSFFSTNSSFGTASTVIGTLIGFLTGVYLPIGQLPETVQYIIKVFPPSHSASLFRRVMMADPIAVTFAGAPAEYLTTFYDQMGITISFGSTTLPAWANILVLIGSAVIFYCLALINISRKKV